jgi:hypothetical protein
MPFEELETEPKELTVPTALISYMRPARREAKPGKPAKPYNRQMIKPCLIITIPTTICGTGKAKAHIFQLGTGADKGKARISGSTKPKAVAPKERMHCFSWKFGFVPKLSDEIAAQERVLARKISDDVFEIDLPEWWK